LSTYRSSLYYSDYLDYKIKLDLIDLKYKANSYYNRYLDTYVPTSSYYYSKYLPLSYYYDYPLSSYYYYPSSYYYYNKYYYYPTSYARYLDTIDTIADIKSTIKRRFYDDEYVRYNAYSKYVDAKYEKLSLENKRKSIKKSYYDDNFVSGYETPVKKSLNYSSYDNASTNYTTSSIKRSDPTYSSPNVAYLKAKYFGGDSSCSRCWVWFV